jgi:hypothetical protein
MRKALGVIVLILIVSVAVYYFFFRQNSYVNAGQTALEINPGGVFDSKILSMQEIDKLTAQLNLDFTIKNSLNNVTKLDTSGNSANPEKSSI